MWTTYYLVTKKRDIPDKNELFHPVDNPLFLCGLFWGVNVDMLKTFSAH